MEEKILNENKELSLTKILNIFKKDIKIIFKSTFIFGVLSVLLALSLPKLFTSTVQLAETDTYGSPIEESAASSIAGLGLIGQTNFKINQAQSIMQSWSFIEQFIYDNDLEVIIYAGNSINSSGELVINSSLYNQEKNKWVIKEPSSWKLYKKFINNHLNISQNKTNSTINVSITHISPKISKEWADMYVEYFNSYMGARKLEQINRNIEYLQEQINKTSLSYMRESFFNIIEEQTKYKMLAESSPEYALTIITPSMVPEIKSYPPRTFICILITLMGAFSTMLYLVLRNIGLTAYIDNFFTNRFKFLRKS